MKRVDVVYACIVNDLSQVLMVYNQDAKHWSMPGGKVEKEEFLDKGLIREVKEETGYIVSVKELISVNERMIVSTEEHAVFFTYLCEISEGRIEITHPEEISKVVWMDYDEADELMPYHNEKLKELIKHKTKYHNQGKY